HNQMLDQAKVLFANGDYVDAARIYKRLLPVDTTFAEVYREYGICLRRSPDHVRRPPFTTSRLFATIILKRTWTSVLQGIANTVSMRLKNSSNVTRTCTSGQWRTLRWTSTS